MQQLSGFHSKYLRALAQELGPGVFVGQKGLTAGVLESIPTVVRHSR
jgi:RNA-binding protein YhbY